MTSPTILIADDDRELVEALAGRCRRLGLSVITAYEGLPAINAIREHVPDLVCLDMEMPAGNGLSICEMMAKEPEWSSIPVILLTGNSEPTTVMRCHEMCAYYVQKCAHVWERIEPLLYELLDIEPPPMGPTARPDQVTAAEICRPKNAELLDAVFEILGGQPKAPAKDDTTTTPSVSENPPEPVDTTPWILHIEDDPDFSEALAIRLKRYGIEVVRAYTGMAGYRTAFLHPANAVILDVELPDGEGDYVLRRLKENPVTRELPVIMLTGRKERTIERKMRALGADAFLNKPVDMEALLRELRRFIKVPLDREAAKRSHSNGTAVSAT